MEEMVEPTEPFTCFGAARKPLREYPGILIDWVDGDTAHVRLHLFRDVTCHLVSVRLYGINSPEKNTIEGIQARTFASIQAQAGSKVTFRDRGPDKYGNRELGDIVTDTGVDVATAMVNAGHAKVWDGTGKKP